MTYKFRNYIRGIVHPPKMKMLSLITHPQVVLNL